MLTNNQNYFQISPDKNKFNISTFKLDNVFTLNQTYL